MSILFHRATNFKPMGPSKCPLRWLIPQNDLIDNNRFPYVACRPDLYRTNAHLVYSLVFLRGIKLRNIEHFNDMRAHME
jgi:hypothetical protein